MLKIKKQVQLKVLKNYNSKFPLPDYATDGSAAIDLRAMIDEPKTIYHGHTELIPTGLAMYIGDPNICSTILPRSGLGHKKGIVLGNLVGLCDSDYQGEIFISCWNRSYEGDYTVNPGDRIAQLMFLPVVHADFQLVNEFVETDRGEGGFGSSGVK